MGCFESRADLTYEEAAMATGENLLLYTEFEFNELYVKLTKLSENGYVSKTNFKNFIDHFRLQFKEERFVSFYEKRMKDNKYSLKFLVTLCILLSKGSATSKANAIFETFMVQSAKVMGKKGLFEFLDLAIDLVSIELPRFTPPPDSINNYKPDDFNKYLECMRASRESIKNEIFEALFVNKCTSIMGPAFLRWADENDHHKYLESIGLRQILKLRGKNIVYEEKKKLNEENKEQTKVKEVREEERHAKESAETTHSHHHHHHSSKED